MKCLLSLLLLPLSLAFASAEEPQKKPLPAAALFAVHPEKLAGDQEVATPDKSSKGYIAAKPDMELKILMEVVLITPRVFKPGPGGNFVESEGDAGLLLNLHTPDMKELQVLQKKAGEKARFYVRVTEGKTVRYFDARIDGERTVRVQATREEKQQLCELLQSLQKDRDGEE